MGTFFIPSENDFRKWIKESIADYFAEKNAGAKPTSHEEQLLTRKEIAKKLKISLVTLTDWVKRGLPSHKQRGRVYFLYSEVIEHIKNNNIGPYKLSRKFSENNLIE